jgi:hypothetical protein
MGYGLYLEACVAMIRMVNPPCEEGRCIGGVAVLKLREIDGKVLSIAHYK